MRQANYILYYESFCLKEKVKSAFTKRFQDSLVYELREEDRLLAGLVSSYFHFVILALDQYQLNQSLLIKRIMKYKGKVPLLVIANDYDSLSLFEANDFLYGSEVYFLTKNEAQDLPGITLRIIKENGYYRRKSIRRTSKAKMNLGFSKDEIAQISIENLSDGGLQFKTRAQYEKNECPYLFHNNQKGEKLRVPIQLLWKKKESDGRWTYGAKYLNPAKNA